jgi:hypothetical protein
MRRHRLPRSRVAGYEVKQVDDTPTRKETIMRTEATASKQLPAAVAVVTHAVENHETWKRAFDAHAGARKSAGVTAAHVNCHAENPMW